MGPQLMVIPTLGVCVLQRITSLRDTLQQSHSEKPDITSGCQGHYKRGLDTHLFSYELMQLKQNEPERSIIRGTFDMKDCIIYQVV